MIRYYPRFKFVYLIIDISIISLSFFLSLYLTIDGFSNSNHKFKTILLHYFILFVFSSIVTIFFFYYNNLYKRHVILSFSRQIVLLGKSIIISGMVLFIVKLCFVHTDGSIHFNKLIIYYSVISYICYALIRAVLIRQTYFLLSKKNIYIQKILIVGGDQAGKDAFKAFKDPTTEFQVVGFLDDYKETGEHIEGQFYNLGQLEDLKYIVTSHNVNEIIIAIDDSPYERIVHIVEKALEVKKPVSIYSNFLKIIAEKLKVEYYSTIPVVKLSNASLSYTKWIIKRTFDILFSLSALFVLMPVFLLISIGIKLSSSGPIIFKQKRIGKNGKPFNFYKFRSMHLNNDNDIHKKYVQDFILKKENKIRKEEIFKITDDPRIFKFGKFLRKTSLDEFPQLFNVIKGEMSIVGPRPCLEYEWNCYENWHKKRLNISAGCTGMWQVFGRSKVDFEDMVILDLYYSNNISLQLDIKIILNTLPVILFARGGY